MQIPLPNCFINYIGVPASCNIGGLPPVSGRYITSLTGFSALKIAQINDSDDVTVKEFCERMIAQGILNGLVEFKNAVYATQKHEIETTLTDYRIGEFNMGTNPVLPSPVYLPTSPLERGLRIVGKWGVENRITKIFIRKLNILANVATNPTPVQIKIINRRTNTTDLVNIDLIPNVITSVELNYTCAGNEIYVLLPSVDTLGNPIDVCDTTVQEGFFTFVSGGCCGGGGGGRRRIYDNYVQIDGWSGTAVDTMQLYGIQAEVEAVCAEDELFCIARQTLGSSFANYLLYKVGVEMTNEALIGSDRFNWVVTNNDQLVENKKYYEAEAKLLVTNLATQFKGTLRNIDSNCVRCYDAKTTFVGF